MGSEVNVTNATFQKEVLDSAVPVLADFWAEWCVPCRMVGPMLEKSLRQTLIASQGSLGIFFSRPISLALLAMVLIIVVSPIVLAILNPRRKGAEPR